MTLEDRIRLILDGIDRDELVNDGWWETDEGAEFGKKKLEDVIAVVREYELTVNNNKTMNNKLTIGISILLIVVGWVLSEDSDKYAYVSGPMLALGIIGLFYLVVRWRR